MANLDNATMRQFQSYDGEKGTAKQTDEYFHHFTRMAHVMSASQMSYEEWLDYHYENLRSAFFCEHDLQLKISMMGGR